MKALTDKQERFVHEYLIDQNASAAAVRAGYSEKTKGTQAVELMRNPQVKGRILQELADLYARLKVSALDILRLQVAAAYFDPAQLFDAAQEPVPLHALDAQAREALTVSYDRRRNGEFVMRVKQTPRHVALAALGRRLDHFERMRAEFDVEQMREARLAALAREETQMRTQTQTRMQMREARSAEARGRALRPEEIVLDVARPGFVPGVPMAAKEALAAADVELAAAAEALAQAGRQAAQQAAQQPPHVQAVGAALRELMGPAEMDLLAGVEVAGVEIASVREAGLVDVADADEAAQEAAAGRGPGVEASAAPTAARAASQPEAAAPAPQGKPEEEAYDFRKDPNWMWGGRYRRNPVPPREEPTAEQVAAAVAAARLRPRKMIAPMGPPPGYNPPRPRDGRPEFAIGAGEFRWS